MPFNTSSITDTLIAYTDYLKSFVVTPPPAQTPAVVLNPPQWMRYLTIGFAGFLGLKAIQTLYRTMNQKDFRGQVVLITGGGGRSKKSLGRLLALRFARMGCKVVILDLDQSAINDVVAQIKQEGGFAKGYVCDITNYEKVYEIADVITKDVGPVDVLVNNAGIVSGQRILEANEKRMEVTMKVNTIAHFWTVKAFLPGMMERQRGHIITIASAAGLAGSPGLVDYTASKFGAVGFHESLLAEVVASGMKGIDLTCVCPFFIDTGMFQGVKGTFFCPVLNANDVAKRIVQAAKNRDNLLMCPSWLWAGWVMRLTLPQALMYRLSYGIGLLKGMDTFEGHAAPSEAQEKQLTTGSAE
uniref:Short-chain dehydrogenase/reductase 3 n=1 Tax=Percolomonas cosmopolitus TaxID=63605 RepID=A0A7S1PGD4_9EUKA|eukprot:CAMPEP_0117442272 /NCGR_PEP_ID=MMETSP0759-20121206/4065_1 /TAXON_ID=63605 /ORGANISM="Percolomonas cosmopolitus, Strain WS" /LENGTH=355 /DNA_ID=CAMNT_0005234153 /DNA_START=41 /DNA_END=1108 /DNA_ORIENTATION=-